MATEGLIDEDAPDNGAPMRDAGDAGDPGDEPAVPAMVRAAGSRLGAMHRAQVRREPWPDFAAFDPDAYPFELRRRAAVQWAGRARNEHGSIHQFSALAHALTEARVPVTLLGALARLLTDEVRHAELCAQMALCCDPEGPEREPAIFRWPALSAPWPAAPTPGDGPGGAAPTLRWAADVVATACCVGETLSRPMLDALATVTTDPIAEAVVAQIVRDEHLHAAFGWEVLGYLTRRLGDDDRRWLDDRLARRFAGFERNTARGITAEQIADREVTIEPGDPRSPNFGTLSDEQYAVIFFATFEQEILPGFRAVGLEADRAWAARLSLLER